MWKKILGALALVIVAVLVYASTRPDTFRVERSIVIDAGPSRIYALLDDFHHWERWSPWEKLDPALKRTFSGPTSGIGAIYEWQGNRQAGQGRMEIVDSMPGSRLGITIHFIEPFDSTNRVVFALTPDGAATRVVWSMDGPALFVTKVMGLFFSMDRIVGEDFEHGLAALKAAAERPM